MNRKKYLVAGVALAMTLVFVTACGKSSSPTSPSTSGAKAGASITGTVSGTASGSSTGYAKLDNTSGITVTIAGTNLTVAVDSSGKFVFTGVPAGTVQLIFTSTGGTATLTLDGVKETDTITVKVTIKGTTASIDEEERNGQTMTEIEDRITAINPAGTTRTLDVGPTRVSVPTTAVIRHGDTTIDFTALKVGDRVHVRGTMSGTLFTATEVMVQNTNENVPVNINGAVTEMQATTCPAIRFVVGGWTVETNSATDFQKNSCSLVVKNATVHVKGDIQSSGRVLASSVQVIK